MTTATLTLTDFLLARYAEDEDRARTFLADNHAALVRAGLPFRDSATSFVVRVLAECEAKRRIVQAELLRDVGPVSHYIGAEIHAAISGRCATPVMRLLALPYADHPDWREEWRP